VAETASFNILKTAQSLLAASYVAVSLDPPMNNKLVGCAGS